MVRIFGHYIPRALVWLSVVEGALSFVALYVGVYLRFPGGELTASLQPLAPKALLYMAVMMGAFTGFGLYQRGNRFSGKHLLLRLSLSFCWASLVMVLLFYTFPQLFIGRGAFALTLAATFIFVFFCRFVFVHIVDDERMKKRVLVLGTGRKASLIGNLCQYRDWHGSRLLGFVHVDGEPDEVRVDKILNPDVNTQLPSLVRELAVEQIIIAMDDSHPNYPTDALLSCKLQGVEVVDTMTFFERNTGKIELAAIHPEQMVFLDGFEESAIKVAVKRAFDVVVSLLVLSMMAPVMLLFAFLIWLESGCRHSVIYRQVRVGKQGHNFTVYKFRSMKPDAEKDGKAVWAQKNDTRITRIGHFIRKTRIDELPQLLNVLLGTMSFVGPRPERPQFVAELQTKVDFYQMRHRVKPGITGWAQICYPYGASVEDAKQKLQYDLYYIKNYSLFLDLTILFQTAQVVIWGEGAR